MKPQNKEELDMSKKINPKLLPFKKGDILEVEIDEMAFGGNGIVWTELPDGRVPIFIENAIKGQTRQVQITKIDRRHIEARDIALLHPSPNEIEIPYQAIPGAPYATLPYDEQQAFKQNEVLQLLNRIGKIDAEPRFDTYLASPSLWHYRNKMEYSFSVIRWDKESNDTSDDFALGFKKKGTWWIVEPLHKDSGLLDADLEGNLKRIEDWCIKSQLPAWHPPQRHGFYRYLVARKSYLQDQILLNLVTTDEGIEKFDSEGWVKLLKDILGARLAGVIHTINNDTGDRVDPLNGEHRILFGRDKITEDILGLQFEISMKSFFQTNPKSAERLYAKAIDYVKEVGQSGTILDLFCGTGTISQLLKKAGFNEVIGVDIEPKAIENAKENAARNNIDNITFFATDVGKFLLEQPQYHNQLQVLMMDPPRAGIAPKTLRKVIDLNANYIVYISCNPATFARDTETLEANGYTLEKWSLIDQFPHTSHVEVLGRFKRLETTGTPD
jgi:23S rRNA (uracil-5-)-methyltransferase RumA